jgi:hypothetical protein
MSGVPAVNVSGVDASAATVWSNGISTNGSREPKNLLPMLVVR